MSSRDVFSSADWAAKGLKAGGGVKKHWSESEGSGVASASSKPADKSAPGPSTSSPATSDSSQPLIVGGTSGSNVAAGTGSHGTGIVDTSLTHREGSFPVCDISLDRE